MINSPTSLLFAWPSVGRRETLAGSVESFIANLDGHGDNSPCLFAFDSPLEGIDKGLSGKLSALACATERKFFCCDRASRERFVALLPENFDRDSVRYALLQDKSGQGVGTNRNAILLSGLGSLIVSTDDDLFCKPVVASGHGTGIVDVGNLAPCDTRYFPDRASLLAVLDTSEIDVAAEYRSLFGQQADDGLSACLVACAGSYGDSGYGNARATLVLEDAMREALHDGGYERMRFSREIVRIPDYDVSGLGTYLMGMQCAFDARALLPPFFPVGRNEDGFFALTLRIMYPASRTLYPAFGFLHDPPESRPFDHATLTGFKPPLNELLMSLSIAVVPPENFQDPRERLLHIGEKMREAASLSAVEFTGIIHETWSKSVIAYAEHLESLLGTYDRIPISWAEDVDVLLENVYAHVREPALLFGASGCNCSVDEVRSHADRYGRLLCQWPDLVEYVRSSGDPLSLLAVDLDDL